MFLQKLFPSIQIQGQVKTFKNRRDSKILDDVKKQILLENVPAPLITPKSEYCLIFVSIPSYRDPSILKTVRELYFNAKYPEMIQVGVCEQN